MSYLLGTDIANFLGFFCGTFRVTLSLLFRFSHNLRDVSSQCLLILVIKEFPALLVASLIQVIIDSASSKTVEMLSVFVLYSMCLKIFLSSRSFSICLVFFKGTLNPFLHNLKVKIENFLTVSNNAPASYLAKIQSQNNCDNLRWILNWSLCRKLKSWR